MSQNWSINLYLSRAVRRLNRVKKLVCKHDPATFYMCSISARSHSFSPFMQAARRTPRIAGERQRKKRVHKVMWNVPRRSSWNYFWFHFPCFTARPSLFVASSSLGPIAPQRCVRNACALWVRECIISQSLFIIYTNHDMSLIYIFSFQQ